MQAKPRRSILSLRDILEFRRGVDRCFQNLLPRNQALAGALGSVTILVETSGLNSGSGVGGSVALSSMRSRSPSKRTRRFDVLLGAVDLPLFVSSSPMTDAVAISTSGQILPDATGSGGENTVLLRRGDNQVAKSLGINQLVP